MRVLSNLPNQRTSVSVRHRITGFNALIGFQKRFEYLVGRVQPIDGRPLRGSSKIPLSLLHLGEQYRG
jgi:hypothetical protein